MRHIRVLWEDGTTSVTQINGTDEEIRRYYVGQYFNLELGELNDKMIKAVGVEFVDIDAPFPEPNPNCNNVIPRLPLP